MNDIVSGASISATPQFSTSTILELGLQFTLVVVGAIYAYLTWKLAQSSRRQISLWERQLRLSVLPFISVEIINDDPAQAHTLLEKSPNLSHCEVIDTKTRLISEDYKYVFEIFNPSDRIARDIYLILYDADSKALYEADWTAEWLAGKDSDIIFVGREPSEREELTKQLEQRYHHYANRIMSLLDTSPQSYYVAIYTDIEGRPYAVKQEFYPTEGEHWDYNRAETSQM